MDKNLKPIRITDVFENAELYISEFRREDGTERLTDLLCYIWAFVESIENDGAKMEALALFVTDHIYRYAAFAKMTDKYTYMFFEVLAKELFNAIKKRGVSFFYILDNTIREDRFKLTTQLFGYAGFSVVTPYFDTVDHSLVKDVKDKKVHFVIDPPHNCDYCNFEIVEAQIKKSLDSNKNIIYIEKDSSINYLDEVIDIGKKTNYLCVLRNQAPTISDLQVIRSNF